MYICTCRYLKTEELESLQSDCKTILLIKEASAYIVMTTAFNNLKIFVFILKRELHNINKKRSTWSTWFVNPKRFKWMTDSDEEDIEKALKIVLVGDSCCGKTALCVKLSEHSFQQKYIQVGIVI